MFNFRGQSMFRTRSKSPIDLVKALYDTLIRLGSESSTNSKVSMDVIKYVEQIKDVLFTSGLEFTEAQISEFVSEVMKWEIIPLLIVNLSKFDQETRKNVSKIFTNLIRYQEGTSLPIVGYIAKKSELIFALFHSYENPITALPCGVMLRECLKFEPLANILLHSKNFYSFFDYINTTTFDLSSDAFNTFREILTRHKKMVSRFILVEYEPFFDCYDKLLLDGNYVSKRLAIKLLGDVLLDRTNFRIMTIYISKKNNLKMIMNLLKDKSKNIQLESFHIFKIFVANPKKAPQIQDILMKNKDKLIEFLDKFHNDKNGDQRFLEEKVYVIKQIKKL